eukprot:jgi/Bigna1/145994/aug1.107_g20702
MLGPATPKTYAINIVAVLLSIPSWGESVQVGGRHREEPAKPKPLDSLGSGFFGSSPIPKPIGQLGDPLRDSSPVGYVYAPRDIFPGAKYQKRWSGTTRERDYFAGHATPNTKYNGEPTASGDSSIPGMNAIANQTFWRQPFMVPNDGGSG